MAKTRKYQNEAVKKAYQKERNRLQHFVRAAGKRGYLWEKKPIPEIPKTVTEASVRRLQKLTPTELYKKALYIADTETGELIPGTLGRKVERKKAAEKGKRTREIKKAVSQELENIQHDLQKPVQEEPHAEEMVIENLMAEIDRWDPSGKWTTEFEGIKEKDKNKLKNILQGAINVQGKKAVARRIQENAEILQALFAEILYGSGSVEYHLGTGRQQVQLDLQRVATIIQGRSMTPEESINFMTAMEESEFAE